MRSESDGHCAPSSFPGLAVREATRRRDPVPLVRSFFDRYRPTVDEFLRHVAELRERTAGTTASRSIGSTASRPWTAASPSAGTATSSTCSSPRAIRASPFPPSSRAIRGVVHAYEPHEYASRVTVVGAGMAAATEWLNALAAGSEVVSVRRREPARRPLNVARPFFTKRGLAGFYAAPRTRRAALLHGFGEPSYPPGRAWDAPIEAAEREGRFRISPTVDGAEQVICATGFEAGFRNDPLLARLVDEHGLESEDRWIVLADDSTVPGLTDATRTLALAGVPGQWAFPAADTLVGMKVAARRFRNRVLSCPTP